MLLFILLLLQVSAFGSQNSVICEEQDSIKLMMTTCRSCLKVEKLSDLKLQKMNKIFRQKMQRSCEALRPCCAQIQFQNTIG